MPVDKKKLYLALSRGKETRGVRVPASIDAATEKIIVTRTTDLWKRATIEASKLATGKALTSDAARDVGRVVSSVFRQYGHLTSLEKVLRARWEADDAYHRVHFLRDINQAVGVNISSLLDTVDTTEAVKTGLEDAMGYIVTLDKDLVTRLTSEVWAAIQRGDDALSIQKFIIEGAPKDYPAWRARLIARDQTGKLFGNLSKERQQGIGIEKYLWGSVRDGAVRDSHRARDDGKTLFSWDKPPEDGHPGQPIECRCVAKADLSSIRKKLLI